MSNYTGGYDGTALVLAENYSTSQLGKKYFILRAENGSRYCTCPGWITSKKKPKTCKHLNAYTAIKGDPIEEEPTE